MLHRREFLLGSIGTGIVALRRAGAAAPPAAQPIRALLKQAVGAGETVAGMIAVVADESGTRMVAHGSSGIPSLPLDGNTIFEIGSITKVLTALLLVDMVARREVAFDDPVANFLPSSVTLHERGGPITLLDLATYTSGLPNTPSNFRPPLADYRVDKLYEFLSTYVPKYDPGAHYEYANLGFGVLGIALARRAGRTYEKLLIERICDPLDLEHTRITLTDEMQRHLAQGHGSDLKPRALLDLPSPIQGAGAVRSSAKNLAIVLKACTGLARTPLNTAFGRLLETRRHTTLAGTNAALGWLVSSDEKEEIVWKSGLTDGFSSFIGFSRRMHRGVLVLSNFVGASLDVGTIDLGMKLINSDFHPADFHLLYSGAA